MHLFHQGRISALLLFWAEFVHSRALRGRCCWSLGPFLLCPLFALSSSGSSGDLRGGEFEGEVVDF